MGLVGGPNETFSAHMSHGITFESGQGQGHEALIRTVLQQRNQPVIINLSMMLPTHQPFYSTSEVVETELSSYYGLPHISVRAALW